MNQWEKYLLFGLNSFDSLNEAAVFMTLKVAECKEYIQKAGGELIEVKTQIAGGDYNRHKIFATISYRQETPIDFTDFDNTYYKE